MLPGTVALHGSWSLLLRNLSPLMLQIDGLSLSRQTKGNSFANWVVGEGGSQGTNLIMSVSSGSTFYFWP